MSYDTSICLDSNSSSTAHDPAGPDAATLAEIHDGLSQPQKRLPTRLLYDERGSRWFEAICRLPEYYVTRAELQILKHRRRQIAAFVGDDAAVIEPGAGCGTKARLLLRALSRPRLYLPMDIDDAVLNRCAQATRRRLPGLEVMPLHGDFQQPLQVPEVPQAQRRLLFFPGSTIGNFDPAAVVRLLRQFAGAAGREGRLLIGVDLRKNAARLRRAYDDAAGVTARFNLNLLTRINREFDADFDTDAFTHCARYDKQRHRIEMHLISRRTQRVRVGTRSFHFARDESIHTESSYKYLPSVFANLAATAGWRWMRLWHDDARRFAVMGFEAHA